MGAFLVFSPLFINFITFFLYYTPMTKTRCKRLYKRTKHKRRQHKRTKHKRNTKRRYHKHGDRAGALNAKQKKRVQKLVMGWWKHHDEKDMLRKHRDSLYYPRENAMFKDQTHNRYLGNITRQGIPHEPWQLMDRRLYETIADKEKHDIAEKHERLVARRLKKLLKLPTNHPNNIDTILDRGEELLYNRILHNVAWKAKQRELARIKEHHSTHGVVLPYSHDRVRHDIMQTIDDMQLREISTPESPEYHGSS
tara:strand:+ start:103 stop:858 length:756 start_codon:yes stop_codon:yes gene_type:complete